MQFKKTESTLYYATDTNSGERREIGVKVAGWRFLFRYDAKRELTSYRAWRAFIRRGYVVVETGHGIRVDPDRLDRIIQNSQDEKPNSLGVQVIEDADGFEFAKVR
jgi:hypothetical protein